MFMWSYYLFIVDNKHIPAETKRPPFSWMNMCLFSLIFQWGLSTMAKYLNHYLNQCRLIVNWTTRNKLQWNMNWNTKPFFHEKAFEIVVCKMAAILSRGRWVKCIIPEQLSPVSMLRYAELTMRLYLSLYIFSNLTLYPFPVRPLPFNPSPSLSFILQA